MIQSMIALFVLVAQVLAPIGAPAPALTVQNNQATLNFPEQITFQADLQAAGQITSVVLEYRLVEQTTCGTVIAKSFPDFTPADKVSVSWTWEMKQSGSLPPGAQIAWRWRVTDASGKETVSEEKTVTWLDSQHDWKVIEGDGIGLYYYDRSQSEAQKLHQAAVDALQRLKADIGFEFTQVVNLFIYANNDDMKDAVLYEPNWTGGQAFSNHRIIIIGIGAGELDWGLSTEAHELTHVLIGQLTFSCLGEIPTWLNEGLAMYGEGGPSAYEKQRLDQAIADNSIFSIRSLSGGFSEDSEKANLSYSESYSVVNFLIQEYPKEKLLNLLSLLKSGETIDQALLAAYGFADTEALEDAWRTSISASPRLPDSNEMATPTPTATQVPTLQPVTGGSAPTFTPEPLGTPVGGESARPAGAATPTTAAPAQAANSTPAPEAAAGSGTSPLILAAIVIAILLAIVIFFFLARRATHSS